ncbi:MAG: hypothetical protein FWH00_01795 [Oscillospiraceae bacterium]|nr:hypothetical protein [Oscillospiraceae bacterium]
MKLLIIADDLTGALDTAVQISKRGVKTLAAEPGDPFGSCEALCINLDMRHDKPDTAYRKVSDLLRGFPASEIPYIYLKTDSVLRGNLSAMFAAALAETGETISFIPAYPKAGRVTIGGEQFVRGQRLEHSPFANDPLNPMLTSNVADILNASHRVDHVRIFDCETQEQLARIGETLQAQNALRLTAGCAGFAEVLCGYIPFLREPASFAANNTPVLFLSGSANSFTFDQLAYARRNGIPVLKASSADADAYLADKYLSEGKSVVLATAQCTDDLTADMDIRHIFSGAVSRFVNQGGRNLAVFGGDTALAVLRGLDCGCVRPLAEIQPGIPLCAAGNLNLATKSGGLGDIDAVIAIEEFMRGFSGTQ